MDDKSESDADIGSILLKIAISLLFLPSLILLAGSEKESVQSDFLAFLLAITLSVVLLYTVHNILKKRCQSTVQSGESQKSKTIFSVFSLNDLTSEDNQKEKQQNYRRKIDPKYFKPKFIINELMSMWDTTYTVITWGSFYVIGGTLVATERLARKIKTKCTREGQRDFHNNSTGRADSFATFDSFNGSAESESNKNSFRRVKSWAKRSYSSAKKKFNKFVGTTGVPQITGLEASQAENAQ